MPERTGWAPHNATLTVETKRKGAASKAGHDLVIEVTSWEAELDVAKEPAITLRADGGSLRVREGSGGVMTLGEDEKAGHRADDRRRGAEGSFHRVPLERPRAGPDGTNATVHGELELAGTRRPISFDLSSEDGRLTGRATLRQSDWGIKPYTALFGTLKVADEVEIGIDAGL